MSILDDLEPVARWVETYCESCGDWGNLPVSAGAESVPCRCGESACVMP